MLLNASGCLDALTAPEVARSLDAFVTKTITPEPRGGNAPVRIAETESGMLNSIGLANPGRERFLSEKLPQLRLLGVPLWVSVGGFTARDYAETCAALEDVTIELNLSCPNVADAPETAAEIIAVCREATSLPLYAKLSPSTWDLAEQARAAEASGADGLSLVNTLRGLALDERTLRPQLAAGAGGYSGPALKPVALAAVFACAQAVDLPIVGMGGVRSGLDVLELIAAGASAVALGTVLFSDPAAPARIRSELAAECGARGLGHHLDALRLAHSSLQMSGSSLDNRVQKKAANGQKIDCLTDRVGLLVSRAHGAVEDASAGSAAVARPEDGSPQAGQRHPGPAGKVEEGPEGRARRHRGDPARPT